MDIPCVANGYRPGEYHLLVCGQSTLLDRVEMLVRGQGEPVTRIVEVMTYEDLPRLLEGPPSVYVVAVKDAFGAGAHVLRQQLPHLLANFVRADGLYFRPHGAQPEVQIRSLKPYVGPWSI